MPESNLHNFKVANVVDIFHLILQNQLSDRELILENQKDYNLLLHSFDMNHIPNSAFEVVDKEDPIHVPEQQDLVSV